MDIKNRIKKLGKYFREMQITTLDGVQVIYVVVVFPRGWIIDEDINSKFGVTVNEGHDMGEFYFCADIDTGEDAIFDAIDYNIEKMQDAIERAQLLAAKTKELKEIFENDKVSLDDLRGLKFVYGQQEEPAMVIAQNKRGRKPAETVASVVADAVSEEETEVKEA